MRKFLLPILLLLIMAGCTKSSEDQTNIEGYKPIYIDKVAAFDVSASGPVAFESPGKMFLWQNFIYVTDIGYGVHIIDNSDPSKPNKLAFISIPGVKDAAVKNGTLLADNFTDLVAFDNTDVSNITLSKRLKGLYPFDGQFYPEFGTGYFECADTTNGYVLKWEKAMLNNPKCYR